MPRFALDIESVPRPARSQALLDAVNHRVVIADGAMGTMLQGRDLQLETDFQNLEGCNEILNDTRPDVIADIHDAYFATGIDAVETNTFGANWSNLSDYGIDDRIEELARKGTKLASLGHTSYDYLKQTFALQAEGLIDGGADAFLIETSQDLLQTKAAVNGCKQAIVAKGVRLPIFVEVTVETTGTMLMGSEIGAALTALEPLGVDAIGLNCATGPDEMSEHLRHLSKQSSVAIACMPNAGLPVLGANGAHYPLSPAELATAHEQFVREFGLGLVGGCCGTTPEHMAAVVERLAPFRTRETGAGSTGPARVPTEREAGVASLYQHVNFDQESAYLAIGERTNANGSKAFRQAMLEERWDDCVDIAREQIRVGAHLLDVCVDYVGRDGPNSRFARIMPLVKEHGTAVIALTINEEGQARTTEGKVAIASRLVDSLVGDWGMRVEDIIVDCLTFPVATGQEETRRDGIETIEAIRQITAKYPGINTTLGVSNVSFGLNPAARSVLNSAFMHEAVEAGLTSGIIDAAKIVPLASIS